MKKILLIMILFCGLCVAQESNLENKWRGFFGVEGGAGLADIQDYIGLMVNLQFLGMRSSANSWDWTGGILGGWQKYTSEKIGMRNVLGLRAMFFNKDFGKYSGVIFNRDFGRGYGFNPYYAFDGLFDFVRSGNNRFGAFIGTEIGATFVTTQKKELMGAGLIGARIGLKAEFENKVIDITLSAPILSVGFLFVPFNSTLTLGYKYLF